MDPEPLINSPESDEDLFDISYPPSSGQQTDLSQASERSHVSSAISVPHTSRHRSHSSSPNEIPPTPDRSQASSTPPARANSRGLNRHSQLQSPHHRQPASLAAPGHSQQRTLHASRTEPRSETEPELRSPNYGARTTEVDSHSTSTFPEGKRHPLSPKRQQG
ncbi:hypothetical protein OYC64_005525 [Pagothenia borchgrevinki]|uniref:Uncharacterized protein n=1 Tax=Pagothenia borchgrevinki TaxID=8213 RepID=A0ABD2GGW3_PAGBO